VANHPSIAPFPLEAAVAEIRAKKPCVVFAPHVETSAGIILSPEYISALAKATHESREDAIFVLDCIASGNIWTPMRQLGVDVIVTAPQKGWTSPSCAAVVMLSEHARAVMDKQNAVSQAAVGRPRGHSFACNLAKWTSVADAYKPDGGFMCDRRPRPHSSVCGCCASSGKRAVEWRDGVHSQRLVESHVRLSECLSHGETTGVRPRR
jgi:aspartate aminotransferase-like enzyme